MLKRIIKHPWFQDFYIMLLFGGLSYLLGLISFDIPGLSSTKSDFREIPLLISVLYTSNPIALIGISLITSIAAIGIQSIWPTFISHTISLLITSVVYRYAKRQKLHKLSIGLWTLFYVFIYYILMLIPILRFVNNLSTLSFLNAVYQTIQTLPKMIYFARFEIVSTAIITTLYLIQHSGALQLKKHKKNLEIIVSQRTKSLASANEELQSTIEELNRKNKKLTETFDHLKKTQVKLIEKEKMASLGILTSGVAHEINNPLNYIIGACYGLQEHFESTKTGTESTNTFLSALETGVNRASEIVKSLSQFSRDKEDYDEECNIHSIIDNSVIMLNNKLKYKAEIIKNYTDSNCVIKGNVGKLHQVFINIINNACQAIEKKGHITISTKLKNDLFIVKIADGGAGIPEEIIDKIKDPFYTTKEAGEGTGLGLSISDSIIKNHGGILHITSEQNKGTEITIKLPYTNE